jgi:hypothetical protein
VKAVNEQPRVSRSDSYVHAPSGRHTRSFPGRIEGLDRPLEYRSGRDASYRELAPKDRAGGLLGSANTDVTPYFLQASSHAL